MARAGRMAVAAGGAAALGDGVANRVDSLGRQGAGKCRLGTGRPGARLSTSAQDGAIGQAVGGTGAHRRFPNRLFSPQAGGTRAAAPVYQYSTSLAFAGASG